MKRKSGNWLVKIVRLNGDGSHDYLNMLEFDSIDSAKRSAANYSRENGIYATIFDTFNNGIAIYQYHKGRKVAELAKG